MVTEPIEIPIRDEMIRLGQLLKLATLVDDGATARSLIESGEVLVDGAVETRRGRQITRGTVVTCAGRTIVVTGP